MVNLSGAPPSRYSGRCRHTPAVALSHQSMALWQSRRRWLVVEPPRENYESQLGYVWIIIPNWGWEMRTLKKIPRSRKNPNYPQVKLSRPMRRNKPWILEVLKAWQALTGQSQFHKQTTPFVTWNSEAHHPFQSLISFPGKLGGFQTSNVIFLDWVPRVPFFDVCW